MAKQKASDGNLGPWLGELDASIRGLSAKDVGLRLVAGWYEVFKRNLKENPDAKRLLEELLPKCSAEFLSGFVMLVVAGGLEGALLQLTSNRGDEFRNIVDPAARKDRNVRESAEVQDLVRRAGRAFDVRRQGLADYCCGALIIRRYLQFRSGVDPTARELAALLKAGLAASGRPHYLQAIDYDLLRRNLRNYEKKHPMEFATGARCAQMIEVTATTLTT